ncbi:MAG: hypothetical protein Q8Q23_02460 [bacterium]|nr:hypothetical protein [bacterium]
MNYLDLARKVATRSNMILQSEDLLFPTTYAEFMELDLDLRQRIAFNIPVIQSDNYEHFMACLPGKKYAGQHVLIRKQIGGFTVASGYWKWLEFLTHQITCEEVELTADFFSGKHNNFSRQFNKDYWFHVVDDYDGYLPIVVTYPGEGAVFTGVPFPVAQVYGEKSAVWVNEPMYIQIGHLSYAATVAAQFAEVLGDPWRFIEVGFRALQNKETGPDLLLAMLVGGGIISTSNDLAAFINGAPFKSTGTTGHCFYQQETDFKESLRNLLNSPLGKYATVLLDINSHEHGFQQLLELRAEGHKMPFAIRPDSGDVLKQGMSNLTVLQDFGEEMHIVFEDGLKPKGVQDIEKIRRQYSLNKNRTIYGGGSCFVGTRRDLEAAYKACCFHNGTPGERTDVVETMKVCLDDSMKQSIPGMINWFFNPETGFYTIGCSDESPPDNFEERHKVLYDGLTNPGQPYIDPDYDPSNLAQCSAIQGGKANSLAIRGLLGPAFCQDLEPNRTGIAMTQKLREKRKKLKQVALDYIKK